MAEAKETTTQDHRGTVLDVLRQLLDGHQASTAVLEVVTKLVSRNEELEKLLARLRAKGNSSERVTKEQLDLFLRELPEASNSALAEANAALQKEIEQHGGREEKPARPRQPPVRRPAPESLRREDNLLTVPGDSRPCPTCGKARKCVLHETTEVIDFKPAEVFVRRDIREVLACDACDAEMERAPMGDKVVAGGAYGSGLVAKLVIDKYDMGVPLHRQGEELARLGLPMPSSSMSDQIMWATDVLRPVWKSLIADVLGAVVMHIDSTSLPVLDRDHPKGSTMGSLWGLVGDEDVAAYLYTSTGKQRAQRPGEIGPLDLLTARKGPVCADAANLFDAAFKSGGVIEVGCNMHARRYFKKALDANDLRAAIPIAAYKTLYDVEDTVRGADPERRREARQTRSRPVYDELLVWIRTYAPAEPPSSLLGKALQYVENQHVALTRFIDDGRLPIDNGIVERLHRRPAVGRRSYLFAGSHAAGERAAIAYSILGTCRLIGVDPWAYLTDVIPRLARDTLADADRRALTPKAWQWSRGR
ncbi:MAG: IS66 family transposase [Patescibacteria group bacterium]